MGQGDCKFMSEYSSTAHNPKIPTYLPLTEAAEKFGLSKKVLIQMIQAGKIEAVQLPSGELLVAAEKNGNGHGPRTKDEIIAEKFSHLRGQSIKVTEAAEQYNLNRRTILRRKDSGYISEVDPGSYPIKLDEADVAYCAYIYI